MAPSDPRPTKAERRETARAEAQRIRAAQEARARRARLITIAGIVALVLVIGAVVWFVINNAKDAQSATTTSGGGSDVELTGAAISADGASGREVVRQAAYATGLELRDLGFTWVFAPVADVTIGAADPTIGTRSVTVAPSRASEVALGVGS